jgi:hypothetical protein
MFSIQCIAVQLIVGVSLVNMLNRAEETSRKRKLAIETLGSFNYQGHLTPMVEYRRN